VTRRLAMMMMMMMMMMAAGLAELGDRVGMGTDRWRLVLFGSSQRTA
jgi:hypothetical protein